MRTFEELIKFEGPSNIAALLLESVVGLAGIIPPPPGYLAGYGSGALSNGIVYIADEVMVGFGRVGTWFDSSSTSTTPRPDLITFAKGVNSGYVPLGGVIISNEIADSFAERMFPVA